MLGTARHIHMIPSWGCETWTLSNSEFCPPKARDDKNLRLIARTDCASAPSRCICTASNRSRIPFAIIRMLICKLQVFLARGSDNTLCRDWNSCTRLNCAKIRISWPPGQNQYVQVGSTKTSCYAEAIRVGLDGTKSRTEFGRLWGLKSRHLQIEIQGRIVPHGDHLHGFDGC